MWRSSEILRDISHSLHPNTYCISQTGKAFRLALIDGFAGGGVYQHAHNGKELLGSPFIMLDAAKEAEVYDL